MKKSKRHFMMTTMTICTDYKSTRLRKTGGIFISIKSIKNHRRNKSAVILFKPFDYLSQLNLTTAPSTQ